MAQRTSPGSGRVRRPRRRGRGLRLLLQRVVLWAVALVVGWLALCATTLGLLRWVDPPTTALQVQRRVESWLDGGAYSKRHAPRPAAGISPHLRHAVVAAEDARFFTHPGVDWKAVGEAVEDNRRRGRAWRGGSTITQQLVKNLFLTTRGGWARKAAEVPLAYLAEWILPKERILELYLEVIEWGPGVYGAEAAARYHYGVSAASLDRRRAAALAACLPRPRRYRPERMERTTEIILGRMEQMGW